MKQILFCLLCPVFLFAQKNKTTTPATKPAVAFVASLTEGERKITVFPFTEMNRYSWGFVPTSMLERTGISMNDLTATQRKHLENLLQAYLSKDGYKRVNDIMSFEYILKELEPTNTHRIPGNYKVAVYGDPARDSIWGWKFSGHHIALNFTIVEGQLAFAPFFFGANPGIVQAGPKKDLQLLKLEEQLGFQLINSMTAEQQQKTMLQEKALDEIVTGNSKKVSPLDPAGIPVSDLNEAQRATLHQLILGYLIAMPPHISKARMDRLATEEQGAIRFAWAGGKEQGKPHYYRIQGKTFLIELDNTQNNANHVHTVWRDFDGDFGEDLLREHYQHDHASHH